MADAGILARHDRVELIDGEIIDMAPIGSGHAGKTNRLAAAFARLPADRLAVVSIQNPIRLDPFNEPQPDLMLLRYRDDFYEYGHPTAADVLLLVEVADSSLQYDRGTKLELYARHGLPEVWIVDLIGRAVELYREPAAGAYAWRRRRSDGLVTLALLPEVEVDLASLVA